MDYEQKYKAMLEQARDYHSRCQTEEAKRELEAIFPELRVSEDERIINAIIGVINNINAIDWNYSGEQMISWLEKQKEQKPCGCVNVESEYDKGWRDGHRAGLKDAEMQKPVGWSGEDEDMIWNIISIVGQSKSLRQDAMIEWLKSLRQK